MKIPKGVNWFQWRPVMSSHMSVSLHEVKHVWTLDDLCEAHDLLDAYDRATDGA